MRKKYFTFIQSIPIWYFVPRIIRPESIWESYFETFTQQHTINTRNTKHKHTTFNYYVVSLRAESFRPGVRYHGWLNRYPSSRLVRNSSTCNIANPGQKNGKNKKISPQKSIVTKITRNGLLSRPPQIHKCCIRLEKYFSPRLYWSSPKGMDSCCV